MMHKQDAPVYLLITVFFIIHVVLYLQYGLITQLESVKYIHQANLLLNGQFPGAPKYYYYLPIIVLIAAVKCLSLPYIWVAIVQSAVSLFALLLYYKGTCRIFDRGTALFSSLVLCLFLPFFSWDFYLYSDSLFISFSLIFYYLICRFEKQQVSVLLSIFIGLVCLIFTRPFGVLFIPPLFLYLLLSKYQNRKLKRLTVAVSLLFIVFMLIVLDKIFHGGEDMDAMKPFIEEHIICFVPTNPKGAHLDLKHYDNGIRDILYYITHNPLHFLKLMLERLYSFFSMTRPWYTAAHNIFIIVFTVPIYLFFLLGINPAIQLKKNAIIYLLSLIVLYSLAVTFQCDDWHGRFTMLILPPIVAIATFSFFRIMSNLKKHL